MAPTTPPNTPGMACRLWTPHVSWIFRYFSMKGCREETSVSFLCIHTINMGVELEINNCILTLIVSVNVDIIVSPACYQMFYLHWVCVGSLPLSWFTVANIQCKQFRDPSRTQTQISKLWSCVCLKGGKHISVFHFSLLLPEAVTSAVHFCIHSKVLAASYLNLKLDCRETETWLGCFFLHHTTEVN